MNEGGVILYPTDTVWGIGCDATNEEAVRRVYEIKKRADSKAMLVLVDSPVKVDFYVHDVPICCSMSPDSPAAPSVCTALLPRSPRRPLSTTFCGQKQQASISLSFSLSCRFPHLGISSPYRAKLRPGFLYIRKSPDASTPRFLTDLRRNSLTFYFQNHQYQFRKCIY